MTQVGFRGFSDPLEIVDLCYETRLALLQEWQVELASTDASDADLAELTGAIQALEMGASVQGEESYDIPDGRWFEVHKEERELVLALDQRFRACSDRET